MCEHKNWVDPTDLIGSGQLCFGEHGAAEDIPVLTFKAPLPESVTAAYAAHPQTSS